MTTFYVVGASCLGAAAGAVGAHYFFNRNMNQEEALTLGSRNAVNFLGSVTLGVLSKEIVNPANNPLLNNKTDMVGLATFIASLLLIGKATKAFDSQDIQNTSPSWKRTVAISFASTATALVCGFVTMCLVHKK